MEQYNYKRTLKAYYFILHSSIYRITKSKTKVLIIMDEWDGVS